MASRFALPHIDISALAAAQPYAGDPGFGSGDTRVRAAHGARLQNELNVALAAAAEVRLTDPRLAPATSSIIEVELRRGTPADKLDMKTEGVRVGASKENEAGVTTIALHVPDHARPAFEHIIADYLGGPLTKKGKNPPNKGKVEAIEKIRAARINTFWTDVRPVPADAQAQTWWALWCFRDKEAAIEEVCQRLGVRAADGDRRLYFHEVVVIPVLTNRTTIELMLFATDGIAELRLANDTPTFFTDDIRGDQQEWVDGLAERIQWPGNEAPAVCVLDTGINRGHALIEPALSSDDQYSLNDDWGVDDHHAEGHGTSMAGLALHGDLTVALSDTEERVLAHRLESVKILPPGPFDENEPRSYGILTQAGLVMPEIETPERKRAYCMAVTNENVSGSTATSWSAAIDQAAAGCMVADEDEERPRRLIVISAGNVPAETNFALRRPQDEYPIEDPAQAWNALSVGGCTDLISVRDEGYDTWNPLVGAGELSPHSRTSVTWPQGLAPFKPELVMEAGNRAVNAAQTEILTVSSLSLVTTGHDTTRLLVPFEATSAATAQAARMAARLMAGHPEFWPETIRALMIHSAEWTEPMWTAIDATPGKRERYELIRRFGFGVPDFDRANASATNHLAMMAQAEIQPFRLKGTRKFNECHYYTLPISGDLLEKLENEPVELKVTLSYFVDPNPGLSANVDSQRYQSHGLRFDLQRPRETLAQFKKRVNASEREAPRKREGTSAPADSRWILGSDSMSAGSLHCDVWRGPAIELLGRNMLCVKPVNGWWRNRASPDVCNQKTRYSVIVSVKTRNVELDIYTSISAAAAKVPVAITTQV